jgi:hypothetical protein
MFDPYHKWLGIPKEQQPPTHYQLLGISPTEKDVEVIEEAVIRQTTHLRTYQSGPNAQECAKLLNEVAQARITLLDPAKRRQYDEQLAAKVGPKSPATPANRPAVPVPVVKVTPLTKQATVSAAPSTPPLDDLVVSPTLQTPVRAPKPPWPLFAALGGATLLVVGGIVAVVALNSEPSSSDRASGKDALAQGKPETSKGPVASVKPHPDKSASPTPTQPPPSVKPEEEEPRVLTPSVDPPIVKPPPANQPMIWLPPDDASLKRAEAEIQETFKAEYALKEPSERRAFAARLLRKAEESRPTTQEQHAIRFVLFREASDVAVRAGDMELARKAIDELARVCKINVVQWKAALFDKVDEVSLSAEASRFLAEDAAALAEDALATDNYFTALELLTRAEALANKTSWKAYSERLAERRKQMEDWQQAYFGCQAAVQALERSPNDPAANLEVGKYRCLVKGDWQRGLPLLSRGGDPTWKALAEAELRNPFKADAAGLAEGWYNLAAQEEGQARNRLLEHAQQWFERAVPTLTGLDKAKTEKSLEEIAKALPTRALPAELAKLTPGEFSLRTRRGEIRDWLLLEEGGNARSEAAVALGLQWLASKQKEDGHWSLEGYDLNEGSSHDIGATALALLPFLAAGETHKTYGKKGLYEKNVSKGVTYLTSRQNGNAKDPHLGSFSPNAYEHALATMVLCELYGMTKDEHLKLNATAGLRYIVGAQNAKGGWRYEYRQEGDTSVTGWMFLAERIGKQAGLVEISKDTQTAVSKFFDSVGLEDGTRYYYQPGQSLTPAMSAVGLLCREHLGWEPGQPGLEEGLSILWKENPPRKDFKDIYYYYYASQAFHNHGGKKWQDWNAAMRDLLLETQEKGEAGNLRAGSWAPQGDKYEREGGRLFVTALSLLTLETYYRHVPLHYGAVNK